MASKPGTFDNLELLVMYLILVECLVCVKKHGSSNLEESTFASFNV